MPRYSLRTLLIVLALGPPALAPIIWGWLEMRRIAAMSREADHIILSGDDQGKLPPFSEYHGPWKPPTKDGLDYVPPMFSP